MKSSNRAVNAAMRSRRSLKPKSTEGRLSAIDGASVPYGACEAENELPKRLGVAGRAAMVVDCFCDDVNVWCECGVQCREFVKTYVDARSGFHASAVADQNKRRACQHGNGRRAEAAPGPELLQIADFDFDRQPSLRVKDLQLLFLHIYLSRSRYYQLEISILHE